VSGASGVRPLPEARPGNAGPMPPSTVPDGVLVPCAPLEVPVSVPVPKGADGLGPDGSPGAFTPSADVPETLPPVATPPERSEVPVEMPSVTSSGGVPDVAPWRGMWDSESESGPLAAWAAPMLARTMSPALIAIWRHFMVAFLSFIGAPVQRAAHGGADRERWAAISTARKTVQFPKRCLRWHLAATVARVQSRHGHEPCIGIRTCAAHGMIHGDCPALLAKAILKKNCPALHYPNAAFPATLAVFAGNENFLVRMARAVPHIALVG
jgi:hypothetical protein